MTKYDFLVGRSFRYTGHFNRLAEAPLSYDAQFDHVAHEKPEFLFLLHTVDDKGFVVFNKSFGRITVFFKECAVLMPCTVCKETQTDNVYQGHITCRGCADKLKKN